MRPSVIILTFNSADSLPATLASIAGLTDDLAIVDSGSTDSTLEIAAAHNARVLTHAFKNYGDQRNWAIANAEPRYTWQLHLDADERLLPELRDEIAALPEDSPQDGFYLPRMMRFLGRILKHGGMSPTWHMRPLPHRQRRLRGARVRPALPLHRTNRPAQTQHDRRREDVHQ